MVLDSVKFTPAFLYLTGNCMEMYHNGEQATAAMTVARAITERGARKKSFLSLIRVRLNSQKTTTKKGHYTPARILMFEFTHTKRRACPCRPALSWPRSAV